MGYYWYLWWTLIDFLYSLNKLVKKYLFKLLRHFDRTRHCISVIISTLLEWGAIWYPSSSRESNILQRLTNWVCSQMSVRRYSWNSFSENPSYYHAHLNITYIQLFVSRIILVTLLFFFRFTRNTGQARDLPSMVKSLSSFCPKKLQTISLPEDSASRMQRYSLFVLEL